MSRMQSMAKAAFTLVETLVVVAIIAILAAFLFPAMKYAIEVTQRAACAGVQHNLHVLLFQYAADHNNCLPTGYDSNKVAWPSKIKEYVSSPITKTKGDTYCPVTRVGVEDLEYKRDRATWRTDYNVNGNVMGANESENRLATTPGNLVLLYDGGGSAPTSVNNAKETVRHLNKSCFNVLFVDGHIEALKTFDDHKNLWKKP